MACNDYRFITINDSHKLRKELSVLRLVTSSLSSPLSFFSADNSNLYYASIFSDSKYHKIDSLIAAISSASSKSGTYIHLIQRLSQIVIAINYIIVLCVTKTYCLGLTLKSRNILWKNHVSKSVPS
ncbi:hypothetical protein PV328_004218 [Microctonus aethiopoides]|uniref:Uncharacterized protein n=1 Tax=Microctonus aethiopoides TaxID=144406 RepID=A0AA39FA12_9HYME|nr:hypothetical protein PV328_004218 [Microctonus aethiopoides]